MKMTALKMKKKLEDRLQDPAWRTSYDRDKSKFRVEWQDTKEGVTLALPNIIAKYETRGEKALDELEQHVKEALRVMHEEQHLEGNEQHVFPVIRATSFPSKTKAGLKMVYSEHTAETRIYYALDLGKSYRLIDEQMMEEQDWTIERLREIAAFNARSLSAELKEDRVADNSFYFIATQDGYDASRILNESLLEGFRANAKGDVLVAVPHQDVLILADIENKTGYDILAQVTMKYFAEGRVPITSLPFIYEDKKLEPVFIMARNRPESAKGEEK
ncbi:DUF1444 domain-containing protein [Terribacillus saccharophilus]|uniref:UPF0354 protein CHH48_17660 n=1 Tax=Terribacillus saccharophilus TaxID=361277 RepID=A0ABX4GU50_9BACI|nr:DUF1444 domain-containing protein [Terribacillus saccharophilus]PAD33931.1 DUF1444 domain-containing protein [Terribacillus saccharophilus]PAD94641.1 DUF1444 domain-containing protein [Terribacillus saccharophilus]PAD98395.1 DUF1444 domain-containing protein [Terribacillus saccharophilus]